MARFVVNKFSDNMNKIIPFFKKYPLLSVKRLDFQDFCKISCILKEKKNFESRRYFKDSGY